MAIVTLGFYRDRVVAISADKGIVAASARERVSAGVAGVIAVVVSLVQYLTLRYRVGAETVQVRRGLFTKETKTARLERVRSIDVEGNLLMRLLDLRTITIGTGVDDGQVELEGIRTRDAEELREGLLRRSREVRAERGIDAGVQPGVAADGVFPAGDAGALDGRDGPVVIGDGAPESWSRAVELLIVDRERARRLGESAHQYVRGNHKVSTHVSSVMDVYERLVSGERLAFPAPGGAEAAGRCSRGGGCEP